MKREKIVEISTICIYNTLLILSQQQATGASKTLLTGNNTEKIWVHRFLAKQKMIETGGLGGAVWAPGWCLDYNEKYIVWRPPIGSRVMPWWMRGSKSPEQFFFLYNMLKWWPFMVNVGWNYHSVVTLALYLHCLQLFHLWNR